MMVQRQNAKRWRITIKWMYAHESISSHTEPMILALNLSSVTHSAHVYTQVIFATWVTGFVSIKIIDQGRRNQSVEGPPTLRTETFKQPAQ